MSNVAARMLKLEAAHRATPPQILFWTDSDDPETVPERIELCGLTHEECLDLLDDEEPAP